MTQALQRLARAHGIALEHDDNWGRVHRVSEVTLRAVLSAMHVDATDDEAVARALVDVERARWHRRLAPLSVVRSPARPWRLRIRLPAEVAARPLTWRIIDEAGIEHVHPVAPGEATEVSRARIDDVSLIEFELTFDVALPDGYHDIVLLAEGEMLAQGALAVAPRACYRPPSLREGRRAWGAAVQLYGLRSARNWGIGDFTDLAALIEEWGAEGAEVVGVSPLHALYPHDPARASPYSPSSRHFLNILFLDVEAIPEFEHCAEARAHVASVAVRHQLAKLRAVPLVDYPHVATAKLTVLAMVYEQALRDARAGASPRAAQFAAFKAAAGERLRHYALFEALQAHFFRYDPEVWGWPVWPDAYRHPAAPAVRHFETEHAERVDFHAWLQWQAALQRANVAARARKRGLELGLYADLAVSVDRGGADAWADQELYALGAGVGAPPDAFNLKGQDWGLPPMIPQRLRDAGYEPFIALLRANMRDAGALRIDHVMGLLRLYWVPSHAAPEEGAYVHYPLEDLLGLVALESHRHRCAIIGEDLGTVPEEVRRALDLNEILSYRVLLFERDAERSFKPPSAYPECSLAVASTHDLPTLAGWWEGRDVTLRAEHGQLRADADIEVQRAERVDDRGRLLAALERTALLPEGTPLDPRAVPEFTPALACAVQIYLARAPSALMIIQPEDVFGVRDQANLPGTITSYPNWQRKLPVALEAQRGTDQPLHRLAARLARERGRAPT